MRRHVVWLLLCALVTAACGSSADPTTTAPTTTTAEIPLEVVPRNLAEFRAQETACGGEQPPPPADLSFDAPEDMGVTGEVAVTITTSCGEVEVVLDASSAPETVNSFVFLADQGYFDGTVLHRVFPGFIVQGGDPTGTGREGPGYTIPDEFPPDGFRYVRGTIAMANSGPGTTGSQFFVMLADADLPPRYSAFGRMVGGDETLDAIAAVPLAMSVGSMDPVPTTPLQTVYIESVVVDR